MKAIVVSGDDQINKDISLCLQVRYPNFEILSLARIHSGLESVKSVSPDLVILDCTMPDIRPIETIQKIREFSNVAIIAVCSEQTELEKAALLEAGADEYIPKTFSPIMFLALVHALLRRTKGLMMTQQRTFSFGNLTLNLPAREVLSSGRPLHLTPIEYNLLVELVKNSGNVLTNEVLLEKVWGSSYTREPDFVKKYIFRLRRKIEHEGKNTPMIVNERGIGYKFIAAVT
jgi:two-component system, OmpR family, KDP operon response regulator KdpE